MLVAGLRAHRCRTLSSRRPLPRLRCGPPRSDIACDVAILGGTGFIGTHVVQRFVAQGARVSVMARSIRNLPAIFHDAGGKHACRRRPRFRRGCRRDRIGTDRRQSGPWRRRSLMGRGSGAMVGSAETVAKACIAKKVRRLCTSARSHRSISAALPEPVTGATPTDPQAGERADYARAKAMSDRRLLALHAGDGLPVCILRPGVVVGEGGCRFTAGSGSSTMTSIASVGMAGAIHCRSSWWTMSRMQSCWRPAQMGSMGAATTWWATYGCALAITLLPSARRCSGR